MTPRRQGKVRPVITGRTFIESSYADLQRNPEAQEPEAPIVETRVEDRLHPLVVVVERLVLVSALIDTAPGQIGRRWSPLGSTGSAVVARSAARPARPAESAAAVTAAVTRSAGALAGATLWSAGGRPRLGVR